MSKIDVERAFEPGFAPRNGQIRAGLGLPICYQIVGDQQGEIEIHSEPGQGTEVTVRLPLSLNRNSSAPEPNRQVTAPATAL